jgi:hypothetical protein
MIDKCPKCGSPLTSTYLHCVEFRCGSVVNCDDVSTVRSEECRESELGSLRRSLAQRSAVANRLERLITEFRDAKQALGSEMHDCPKWDRWCAAEKALIESGKE